MERTTATCLSTPSICGERQHEVRESLFDAGAPALIQHVPMVAIQPLVVAALTGFISGLLLSIPVGPIKITIVNDGARRGFKWAAAIWLGATVMEFQ